MIESLKLYAQFLKEFPQEPLEISLEVKFYLRDDETPFMLLYLPREVDVNSKYATSMFPRVVEWFCSKNVAIDLPNPMSAEKIYGLLKEKQGPGTNWVIGTFNSKHFTESPGVVYVSLQST